MQFCGATSADSGHEAIWVVRLLPKRWHMPPRIVGAIACPAVPHAICDDDVDGDLSVDPGHLRRKRRADQRRAAASPRSREHTPTIVGEVRYLLGRIDWCTRQVWIGDLHRQVVRVESSFTVSPPRKQASSVMELGDVYREVFSTRHRGRAMLC